MQALFVAGRALFGGFFLVSGLNHFRQLDEKRRHAAKRGVPAPAIGVQASGALLIVGGASVLAGVQPRIGLAAIASFLGPVTLTLHRFWEIEDPKAREKETINFGKNLALFGAALMMTQIEEPWPASAIGPRVEEDMYIHVGGRELRALPA